MSSVIWLVLWLAGLQAAPGPRRASIEGVVVRADASGAALKDQLPNARVELTPGNVVVFTNTMGIFQFQRLPPGTYTISVTYNGLVSLEETRVTLDAGQTRKDLVLPMIAAPVLAGRVFDPQGKPLAAALVRAYQRRYTPYGTQLKIVATGMTNDLGEYRLFGLNFGQYFVGAGYGERDRTIAIGKTQLSANVSRADDGYSTVFYDAAEDLSQARALHLAPGSDPGMPGIYLRDPARFKIHGQVIPAVAGTRVLFAPKGSDLSNPDYFIQLNAGGAFEIRGVSPGSYLFLATADNGVLSSEVVPVTVANDDVDGLRLALAKTVSISGGLSFENSPAVDVSKLHVKLRRSTTEFDQTIDARVNDDGTFKLEHVSLYPEYDVGVEQLPAGTYVKSVNPRELLQGRARVVADQKLLIAVATNTCAAGSGCLDVHVTKRGSSAPGAKVVLLPEPAMRRRADRYLTGRTDESGNLHLPAVPPGTYTVYAFEQIEPDGHYGLAYSPAAEDRFRVHSRIVIISEDARKISVELIIIPAEDTAGGLQ
jgi:hypothetical protein